MIGSNEHIGILLVLLNKLYFIVVENVSSFTSYESKWYFQS